MLMLRQYNQLTNRCTGFLLRCAP